MLDQLELMLSLQEGVNSVIDPDWRGRGNAWHRAIWMECAEILEREDDWKWWKAAPQRTSAAELDSHRQQQQIELCDIWHFVLSWSLQDGIAPQRLLPPEPPAAAADKHLVIEAIVRGAVTRDLPALVEDFHVACVTYQLDFDQLFVLYVGKNVVNRFRQDRGYKSGEYRKVFGGKEDNEHLSEILAELAPNAGLDLPDQLYERLEQRYLQHP